MRCYANTRVGVVASDEMGKTECARKKAGRRLGEGFIFYTDRRPPQFFAALRDGRGATGWREAGSSERARAIGRMRLLLERCWEAGTAGWQQRAMMSFAGGESDATRTRVLERRRRALRVAGVQLLSGWLVASPGRCC